MKSLIRTGVFAALTALLTPLLILTAVGAMKRPETAQKPQPTHMAVDRFGTSVGNPQENPAEKKTYDARQTVRLLTENGVRELLLSDYLVGVLAGELPRSFAAEAVAAQAVAARTFTLRQMTGGKHDGALCSSPSCCQAWNETVEEAWAAELSAAVAATDGQVLCYEGELIEALFFSCSGGRTEAAVAVWGGDVPYLIPVDSPGEEAAPRYTGLVQVSAADFRETILGAYSDAFLSGPPEAWLGQAVQTEGGGVATLEIGGIPIPGTKLRSLFGLNSTNFILRPEGECFVFETLGFGHRVGMSQYGANAMAQNGAKWGEILAHYYPGTELTCLLDSEGV